VNGESLLGTRHKHAVSIMSSLHDNAWFLICDGYGDPITPDLVPAKIDQDHEIHGYSDPDVAQLVPAKVNQGHEPKVSQGRELQFQGRALVAGKVIEGHGAAAPDSGGQGHGLEVQGHEIPSDSVSQGQGRGFQGRVKVGDVSEVNADERWRERARQRRLARYFSTYCCFDWLICVNEMSRRRICLPEYLGT